MNSLARLVTSTPELRDAYAAVLGGIRLNASFASGKSILVTSTKPDEGKTTVASCLAIAASLSGQRVLLIDGDLRRPSLASAAGVVDGAGLGEVLEGCAETADTIYRVELLSQPEISLSVMGAGGKSPEFLPRVDWPRARTLFQAMAERFSLVLFDSPPILAANDALLFAGNLDGVLLVVDAASADRDEMRRAKKQLELVGATIIGAVFNQFDPKIHGRPYHPYRGYDYNSR